MSLGLKGLIGVYYIQLIFEALVGTSSGLKDKEKTIHFICFIIIVCSHLRTIHSRFQLYYLASYTVVSILLSAFRMIRTSVYGDANSHGFSVSLTKIIYLTIS